jgi:septin family protein
MYEKFSLKLQLFIFNMYVENNMSKHMNNLKLIIIKLAGVGTNVDEEDAKEILLNNFPSKYRNVFFTLTQMYSQTLEDILSLLVK